MRNGRSNGYGKKKQEEEDKTSKSVIGAKPLILIGEGLLVALKLEGEGGYPTENSSFYKPLHCIVWENLKVVFFYKANF